MQITKAFIGILSNNESPVIIVDNYNEINNYLDSAEFLVVSTAGNLIIERDHLYEKINSISSDVGLMGHLLQYHYERTPYMHEQFFIINTKAFTKLEFTDNYMDEGIELIRSSEDLHDGHAPLNITLGTDIVQRDIKWGTKLIEQCLVNGYKAVNFDYDWRYPAISNDYMTLTEGEKSIKMPSRGYAYPLISTELFATALRDLTLSPGLDEAQEMMISAVNEVLKFKVLNMWQFEGAPLTNPANIVVSTANGFIGELLAFNSGATSITFYDKNLNNIEFKKHLYSNWDGVDYDTFALEWAAARQLSIEPSFNSEKNRSKEFSDIVKKTIFPIWNDWKQQITVSFVHCDIVSDIDMLLTYITPDTIVHTSTILTMFPFTAIVHDQDVIDGAVTKLTNSQAQWVKL